MSPAYTDLQIDALREVANIGSGNSATALSDMLGRPVDLSVPSVRALSLSEAIEAIGPPEAIVTAVVIPIFGDMDAVVMLLFAPEAADTLCGLLGVEADSDVGRSALGEIRNILGTSYVSSIETLTGLHLEPRPPEAIGDRIGTIIPTALTHVPRAGDFVLVMDSAMQVEGEACSMSFVLVPSDEGLAELLRRLDLGA